MTTQTLENTALNTLRENISAAVVISPTKLNLLIAAMLSKGHVLLEDVPGLGKTMLAKSLARSITGHFRRIQCTPDLLPADVTGGSIYDQREQRFEFMPGPIFGNIILVDEINRASPRTQSSLLESMAEGQVTAEGQTHSLPSPFFIIATQNPVEMAGTFPLPEAQMDRFLISLSLGYPSFEDELSILENEANGEPLDTLEAIISTAEILDLQKQVRQIAVARPVQEYILRLVQATRTHPDVLLGISPRGAVALQKMCQGMAFLANRTFVTPDDVKSAAGAVLGHRLVTRRPGAGAADDLLAEILASISVPL